MPRSAAPNWRARKEPVLDEYIRASIRQADGKCHPDTGHYAPLVIQGLPTRDEAREVVRALHRSSYWLHKNTDLNCSVSAKPVKNLDGSYRVDFFAINKDHTYRYMIEKYGPDPEKWPYSTNRYHKNFNSAAKEED